VRNSPARVTDRYSAVFGNGTMRMSCLLDHNGFGATLMTIAVASNDKIRILWQVMPAQPLYDTLGRSEPAPRVQP
jgi:hypothetical protein